MGPGLGRGPGPAGGGDPPPGGGSVRVVVLGQPGDLQEVEEPALRCRAPLEGRRKPRGTPGGWAAPEDHERVLRSVIRAAWPDREPTWPAFLEGGAVLRIKDADANNWLPRALRSALANWRYRRHNPPPPQPQPPHKRRRG